MLAEIIIYVLFALSAGITAIVTVAAIRAHKAAKADYADSAASRTVIRKDAVFYFISVFIAVWALLFMVAALAFKDTPAAGIPIAVAFFAAEVGCVFLLRNAINWKIELEEDSLTHTDLFGRQNIYAYSDLTRKPGLGTSRYYARGKFVFGVGFVSGAARLLDEIMLLSGERRLSLAMKKVEEDPAGRYALERAEETAWRREATKSDKLLYDGLIRSVNQTGALHALYLADIAAAKSSDERVMALVTDTIPKWNDVRMRVKAVEIAGTGGYAPAAPAILGSYRALGAEEKPGYLAVYDKALADTVDPAYLRDYYELLSDESGLAAFGELICALATKNADGVKAMLSARLENYLSSATDSPSAVKAASNALRALSLTEYDPEIKSLFERVSFKAPSPEVSALAEELCFGYKPR